jgi:hypothetical protein
MTISMPGPNGRSGIQWLTTTELQTVQKLLASAEDTVSGLTSVVAETDGDVVMMTSVCEWLRSICYTGMLPPLEGGG